MDKKVVLVTGSNRGIGKACIEEFAKVGLNVVINYCHHSEEAYSLKEEIEERYNVNVLVVKADISKEEEVNDMMNEIIDHFGRLDILVNNASVCKDSLLMDKRVVDFQRILNVNLIGTYLCSKYASKLMMENGSGSIINVASTNAIDTYYPESCDYDASKAGVISLTHNLAREFAPYIRVNCVCPGWVKTDMNRELSVDQIHEEEDKILVGRFAEADEIAKVILFLASSKASYVNDSIIRVDGGKKN